LLNRPQPSVDLIKEKALHIRRQALMMVYDARQGHPGGDLSVTDILATSYFGVLRYDPAEPTAPDRDRCVMS
jgi:transketolase